MQPIQTPRHGLTAAAKEPPSPTPAKAVSAAAVGRALTLIGVLSLGACALPKLPTPGLPQPSQLPQPPQQERPVPLSQPPQQSQSSQPPSTAARPLPPQVSNARYRNWDEFRLHAGRRLVDANPEGTFTGTVPQPLLAIPVLEVELNADGSVRRITVQRQPSQARDTVQLAIEAVQRAAPFGDVSHLPRPWKFSEVFLFRDDRRFKPRALDL